MGRRIPLTYLVMADTDFSREAKSLATVALTAFADLNGTVREQPVFREVSCIL